MRLLPVFAVSMTALFISGCDLSGGESAKAENCFSVVPGNNVQPYAPIMVDSCSGDSWLLVRTPRSANKADGYTFSWYKLDRFSFPPSIVSQ